MKLKVNFQPVKSGTSTLSLIAYINYGYSVIEEKPDKLQGIFIPNYIQKVKEKVYKPVRISTGITLPAAFWDRNKKKAVGTYSYINERLNEFVLNVERLFNALSNNGTKKVEPEKFFEQVKLHISNKVKQGERILSGKTPSSSKKKITLPEIVIPGFYGDSLNGVPTLLSYYIEHKINQYSKEGVFNSGITSETIRVYRRIKNRILQYEKQANVEFDIRTITTSNVKELITYYTQVKKEDGEDYSYNYLVWLKKEIKNFINKARTEDSIPNNINFDEKFWNIIMDKDHDPYLTFQHLDKLLKKDFSVISKKERALIFDKFGSNISSEVLTLSRDMFLVACNCGARFSDLKSIQHIYYNENDGWYFDYISQKTDYRVKVPVRQNYVIDLYKKYNSKFNLNIEESTFNEAIKAACLLAGLTENFNISTRDIHTGKQLKKDVPLYTLISTKTGRKTFASNEVKEYHSPLSIVMTWTGHKSEKTLRSYLQLKEEDYYQASRRLEQMMNRIKELESQLK